MRAEAARSLGTLRSVESREPIEKLVVSPNEAEHVRVEAARALGEIGEPSSVPFLIDATLRPETPAELQIAVIFALCRYHRAMPDVLSSITPLQNHSDILVADAAKIARKTNCESMGH